MKRFKEWLVENMCIESVKSVLEFELSSGELEILYDKWIKETGGK